MDRTYAIRRISGRILFNIFLSTYVRISGIETATIA